MRLPQIGIARLPVIARIPLDFGDKQVLRQLYLSTLKNSLFTDSISNRALFDNQYIVREGPAMRLTAEGAAAARSHLNENPVRAIHPTEVALLRELNATGPIELTLAAMRHGAGGPSAHGSMTRFDYIAYQPTGDLRNPLVKITAEGKAFLATLDDASR